MSFRSRMIPVVVFVFLVAGSPVARAAAPWIGVELAPGKAGGVAVKRVMDASPGQRAHLLPGDEVVAIDGNRVVDPAQLIAAVRGRPIGGRIRLTVAGPGGTRDVDVQLEPRPEPGAYQRLTLINHPAPDFTPSLVSGDKPRSIASWRGQVVLIDFFASWCGPCMAALPTVEKLHETLAPKGLRVVGVSTEAPEVVAQVAQRHHLKYPVATDEEEDVSARYHVFALPTMVVIDRKGIVREVSVADTEAAEQTLRALLAE